MHNHSRKTVRTVIKHNNDKEKTAIDNKKTELLEHIFETKIP